MQGCCSSLRALVNPVFECTCLDEDRVSHATRRRRGLSLAESPHALSAIERAQHLSATLAVCTRRCKAVRYSASVVCQWVRGLATARRDCGQEVVEYGLIIATIAVVILLGVIAFGNQIAPWFAQLVGRITTVGT